jgi:preprotein translocase subunit SecE
MGRHGRRLRRMQMMKKIFGIFGGLKHFATEVKVELTKCAWPTWAELRQSTVVVIISVFILGFFVGFSDIILMKIIRSII